MEHCLSWWNIVSLLRHAISRSRTFLWFVLVRTAFCVRHDLLGVTSFVRTLGLRERCYHPPLHFLHGEPAKPDLAPQST